MRSFAYIALFAVVALASHTHKFSKCDISKLEPDFPANQTTLVPVVGETAKFVALGLGVQNYSCSATGTFASIGAVANLYDVSCLATSPLFKALPALAFTLEQDAAADAAVEKILGRTPLLLGQHFFVTAPSGTGLSPFFDFTKSQKSAAAFFLGAKTEDLPSPAGVGNIDWLQLHNVQGALAKDVFRVDTQHGQPPASCAAGSAPISVAYAAIYWFFA